MSLPDLLTPAQFSAGTNGQIPADDPRVPLLIAGAQAAVRRYCGWHVAPVIDDTQVLDGPGSRLLVLPTLHLTAVTAVAVRWGSQMITWAEDQDFDWSENGELFALRRCWPWRFRSVTVGFTHGFESAADVVQVIQQVVANAISSPMGATREQAGQVSISWATTAPGVSGGITLLDRDRETLDMYRIRRP